MTVALCEGVEGVVEGGEVVGGDAVVEEVGGVGGGGVEDDGGAFDGVLLGSLEEVGEVEVHPGGEGGVRCDIGHQLLAKPCSRA